MAEHLTHRFELLEERLRRLEKVGFSPPQGPTIAAQPAENLSTNDDVTPATQDGWRSSESERSGAPNERDRRQEAILTGGETCSASVSPSPITSSGQVAGYGRERLLSSFARLAKRQGSSTAANLNCDDRHTVAIQRCREELTLILEEAVGNADHRLRHMVDEIVVRLTAVVERALQKSAGVIASQALQLLEEEIQITTKKLSLNFQKTVRETLEREIEALHQSDGTANEQGLMLTKAPLRSEGADEQPILDPAAESRARTAAPATNPKSGGSAEITLGNVWLKRVQAVYKARKKQPTWRILGLS